MKAKKAYKKKEITEVRAGFYCQCQAKKAVISWSAKVPQVQFKIRFRPYRHNSK